MRNLLNGKKTDRVPNGVGGTETSGLHIKIYERLKKSLKIDTSCGRICSFMHNAVISPEMLAEIGGDIILLASPIMNPASFWSQGNHWKKQEMWGINFEVPLNWEYFKRDDAMFYRDHLGTLRKCVAKSYYFDSFKSQDSYPDNPQYYNPPKRLPQQLLSQLAEDARYLYGNTEYAICCGETIQSLQLKPGGFESWTMKMLTEPKQCHKFLEKACEAALEQLKQLDKAIGQYCDMLAISNDIGDSRGVMIGPKLWRQVYKPHYKVLFQEWHKTTNMKIVFHSCGSIYDILGDLIECGVDIINPVQISAQNMTPSKLKRDFGDEIIFYGGAYDPVLIKNEVESDAVYKEVKHNLEILSKGGKYIFAATHNLPADMPIEHVEAYQAAWKENCN